MKAIEVANKLVSFSPRQFKGEDLARKYLLAILKSKKIDYETQKFNVSIPVYTKYFLKADKKDIKCYPTALKSGKIRGKDNVINSIIYSLNAENISNINFNPHCQCISLTNFYNEPSLAIASKDLDIILKAKSVEGYVKVKKANHTSYNIFVGNLKNPRTISFAHYDSLFSGAIDNASGVAVCMEAIISSPSILEDNLIVFCGAEELSFDKPDYWGHCFRVFEKKYKKLIKNAKKIIVVDCVGSDKSELINNYEILSLYFPVFCLKKIKEKTFALTSVQIDNNKFMEVYHSDLDDMNQLEEKYLNMAVEKYLEVLADILN